jgi:hypothetical protein
VHMRRSDCTASLTVCMNDKNFLVRLDMCLMVGYIYIARVYFIAQSPP